MSSDEIDSNAFNQTLQNKFRKKYETALSNCWVICVPCAEALRGINLNEEFIDLHILRPSRISDVNFTSTDKKAEYHFTLENDTLVLEKAPFDLSSVYIIKILSSDVGYNKEYQPYKILVVDKPLSPAYKPEPLSDMINHLNSKITSFQEVENFLLEYPQNEGLLRLLDKDLENFISTHHFPNESDSIIRNELRELLNKHWITFLKIQPLELQRDSRFQTLLTLALENYIMNHVHEQIFAMLCQNHQEEDHQIHSRIKELNAMGVTADQLGAPVDFAIPLPAAVVELARIDELTCPLDKLSCLRTSLDLVLAELKGAIVDAVTVHPRDSEPLTPTTDDLIHLLVFVLVQAKPFHMASNLKYMEQFQWTLSPSDAISFSLSSFRAAIEELLSIKPSQLQPRSEKVLRELALEDLIKVTGEVDGHFNRSGARRGSCPLTPLDRQLEHVTAMIQASTRESSFTEVTLEDEELSYKNETKNSSVLSSLGPCFGRKEHLD